MLVKKALLAVETVKMHYTVTSIIKESGNLRHHWAGGERRLDHLERIDVAVEIHATVEVCLLVVACHLVQLCIDAVQQQLLRVA